MNVESERRLKRPADVLEHVNQEGNLNLQVCSGCGTGVPLLPCVVDDSGHREVCRMCGLQYELLGRHVNGALHEASLSQSALEPWHATKKRRIAPMMRDRSSDKDIAASFPASSAEGHSFPVVDAGFKGPPLESAESALYAGACPSSVVGSAEGFPRMTLEEGQLPGRTPRVPTVREYVKDETPGISSPAPSLPPQHDHVGLRSACQGQGPDTPESTRNAPASDGMGLEDSIGSIDMTPNTMAESKDRSGAAHLPVKQRQPSASSSVTLIDNENTSSERHTDPNSILVEGRQNARISNEDVLTALQMSLSCPGILRSHNATDDCAREARFAPEQAIRILTRLQDMIQSGYELPPLLPELRPLQVRESHAQALRGLLAANEPRDASSVATSIQISENRDATLVDKHRGGTTCKSLTVDADDSVRGTASPLPQGSTCDAPSFSSRMQDIKPISRGARTCGMGTTHMESSPPDTPDGSKTGATDPDSAVKTEFDEVISQAECRLDTIQDRYATLEQENASLRYQVATLRGELDAMGRARVDALRHGCETIQQLCGVVKQHKCKEEHHEHIVQLTEDMTRMTKHLKRDHVFFHLALSESQRKLEQANSRVAEMASGIPKARELSDAGVDTDRVQYVSAGAMHEPSPDVYISTSRGVQVPDPVTHSTYQEPRGGDYKKHEAALATSPPRNTGETELDALRLKLAEVELGDLRAKLAQHRQSGIDLPATSSLSFTTVPFDPSSVLAQRRTVPGFTEHIMQLEQEADRYLRRQRKRALKEAVVSTTHRHP